MSAEESTLGKYFITAIFFYSSRRRHTILHGDWSSDVCSSDLFGGLAREVAQYAHDERQFLNFDGVAHFHIVRNLHAWWPHPIEFVLHAVSCHKRYPQVPKDGGGTFTRPYNRNQNTRINDAQLPLAASTTGRI